MKDVSDLIRECRANRSDYLFKGDIFDTDTPKVRLLKKIFTEHLTRADQNLLVMYAECQSYRTLGKAMGYSHMTARKNILRIRTAILAEYAKQKDKDE